MYSVLQRRIIALELARAGRNVAVAQKRLREEYENFGRVGDTTLRRLLSDAGFIQTIEMQEKIMNDVWAERAREMLLREAAAPVNTPRYVRSILNVPEESIEFRI